MRYERRHHPLANRSVFVRRLLAAVLISGGLIAVMLLIGIAGYHWIAKLDWVDSLLNASMILGGMGPVNELSSVSSKIFASFYALFSGLVFVGASGVMLSPVFHRILHAFHIDERDLDQP